MRFLETLAVAQAMALAGHALPQASDTQQGLVVLQQDKATSAKSVEVWDKKRSRLFQRACTLSVDSGVFESYPISFAVDSNGVGNVTVGSRGYRVHDKPEYSGGIQCSRMHSPTESLVVCNIEMPSTLRAGEVGDMPQCLGGGQLDLLSVYEGKHHQAVEAVGGAVARTVDKAWCSLHGSTTRAGSGESRQSPLHVQLSETTECGTGNCSIAPGTYRSLNISWTAGVTPFEWTAGDNKVQPTVGTGNGFACDGQAGDSFCLWRKQGQTAYAVMDVHDSCGRIWHSMPYVMRSPNKWANLGYHYCAYGRERCRHGGARLLDLSADAP